MISTDKLIRNSYTNIFTLFINQAFYTVNVSHSTRILSVNHGLLGGLHGGSQIQVSVLTQSNWELWKRVPLSHLPAMADVFPVSHTQKDVGSQLLRWSLVSNSACVLHPGWPLPSSWMHSAEIAMMRSEAIINSVNYNILNQKLLFTLKWFAIELPLNISNFDFCLLNVCKMNCTHLYIRRINQSKGTHHSYFNSSNSFVNVKITRVEVKCSAFVDSFGK